MTAGLVALVFFAFTLQAGPQKGVEGHLQAARKAEAGGDFAAAEREYEKSLKLREDAETWQRLGLVRHFQNKFAQAIPAFEKSVRLKPNAWASRLFLGIAYYRTNQFTQALAHLVRALQLKPGEPETRFWLGVTHLALKNYLQGLEILEDLSREQPENLELLRILAQRYSDHAVLLLNEVAQKHPRSALAYQIHGQALENEGSWEAALKEYRTALALDPRGEGIHPAIGRILWAQGKVQEAVAAFEEELAIRPEEPESHFYLGKYRMLANQLLEARRHLEIASHWTRDSAEPAVALCRVYLQLGETSKAAEAVARAVELAPRSEEIHHLALNIYESVGMAQAKARETERWERVNEQKSKRK